MIRSAAAAALLLRAFAAPAQHSIPYAATQPATEITATSARLNGMATPNGSRSTAWFEWGVDGSYDHSTTPMDVGSGYGVVRVSTAVNGLIPGQLYRFRLLVTNTPRTAYGIEQRFVAFAQAGKVTAWGDNFSGQASVPGDLSNIVTVAAGGFHSLALNSAGQVFAWGENGSGQTSVPGNLSNIIALAGGLNYSAVLDQIGNVFVWGIASVTNVPYGLSNVVGIAAGDYHILALRADGTVVGWGDNSYGQTNVPADLSNVVAVAAGQYHSVALRADGTAKVWGYDQFGLTNVPPDLTNGVAISAGGPQCLALRNDGTVTNWGFPVTSISLEDLSNVVAVASGPFYNLALRSDGTIFEWGTFSYGPPLGLSNVIALAAGQRHSLAAGPNVAPLAVARILYLLPNRDSVITLSGSDINGDSLKYRVKPLPSAGTLYQYDAGNRGAAILSSGTILTDPSARVIFSPATNGFGSPYSVFGFVSDDGDLVSSEASVTLNIVGTPYAFTQPAQGVTETSALLRGMATPNGSDSIAWFEWTQDGTNWQSTPANTAGDSAGVVAVSATITNLTSGIGYRFRVGVSNQFAVVYGAEQRFATGGKPWAWGDNQYGESTIPVGLDKVVCVSPAYQLSLALRTDGTVFSWGYPTNGLNYPTNIVALSARFGYILGLNADGTVFETGSGEYGKIPVPDSLSNVVMVGMGWSHRIALKSNGTVAAWGRNSYGQTNVPAGLSNVVSISAGANHSVALKADGTVISWGDNTGYATNTPSMTNVIAIAAGYNQGMALKAEGRVVTWGNGSGHDTRPPASETNIVAIASYDLTSLALRRDGTVGAWGYNGNGQTSIPPIRHAVAIAAGELHSMAISEWNPYAFTQVPAAISSTNASLAGMIVPYYHPTTAWFQWGTNSSYGQTTEPVSIGTGAGIARVTSAINNLRPGAIYFYRIVASNDLEVVYGAQQRFTTGMKVTVWGGNTLGNVTNVPKLLNNAVATSSREYSSAALTAEGKVVAWGDNSHHQTNVPSGLSNAVAISVGGGQDLALRADGTVAAWGTSAFPVELTNAIAIAAGYSHGLALLGDGHVFGWGLYTNTPASLSNAVAIAAGENHNLVLRADGTVVAWGDNHFGQTNVPPGLSGVIAIAGANGHSLALKDDGKVVVWGDSSRGQTNIPGGLSNVVAIAAGYFQSVALRSDGHIFVWVGSPAPPELTNAVAISAGFDFSTAIAKTRPALANLTVSGLANHDLSITLPGDVAGLDFHVTSLPLQGVLYQYSSGVRGGSIMDSGTVISDSGGRLIFAPARNAYGSPYASFNIIANNGDVDSAPATITVNISAPDAPSVRPSFSNNGAFELDFNGDSNTVYCVWASTNLANWEYLGPASSGGPGLFLFVDQSATSLPQRFYRISTGCLAPAAQFIGITGSVNSLFELRFVGQTNSSYRVWGSGNLTNWDPLGLATELSPGLFRYIDLTSANYSTRFYRAGTP